MVSVRYAKALLAFAKENGKEDRVYAEVKALADHYAQLPKLKKAIENPVLAEDEKLKLLIEVAGGEKGTFAGGIYPSDQHKSGECLSCDPCTG